MSNFVNNAIKQFTYYKELGEKTIAQLTDQDLLHKPTKESNSICIIVQHLNGNMLSRWTDFLTTDGEKEWRKRDAEFDDIEMTKESIVELWNKGWQCLFDALQSITDKDLESIIYIRNMGQTVHDGITRQLCHYSYHIGQIVYIGKMIKDTEWHNLSIAKNASETYNSEKFAEEKRIQHFNDNKK